MMQVFKKALGPSVDLFLQETCGSVVEASCFLKVFGDEIGSNMAFQLHLTTSLLSKVSRYFDREKLSWNFCTISIVKSNLLCHRRYYSTAVSQK